MNAARVLFPVLLLSMLSGGCSSQDSSKAAPKSNVVIPSGVMMAENRKHPLAKHIELVGFRPLEPKPGKITVRFGVVNHSDADISDLGLSITLRPVTAKSDEAPFCSFTVKIPTVAPQELVNTSGDCNTTLRVYELPDWQFIRASYQITSPQL